MRGEITGYRKMDAVNKMSYLEEREVENEKFDRTSSSFKVNFVFLLETPFSLH